MAPDKRSENSSLPPSKRHDRRAPGSSLPGDFEVGENGVVFLTFPNLKNFSDRLGHAVFTRTGGRSRAPYDSLNSSVGDGDDPRNVARNRALIQEAIQARHVVYPHQVHGDRVAVLRKENCRQPLSRKLVADALICNVPELFIAIQVADCQAVLLYDPENEAVANIHAGWRGSVADIIGKTVTAMKAAFGTRPERLVAAVGPSLGPCCAEFVNYETEIPQRYWQHMDQWCHFDFWSISAGQLIGAGVPAGRIHASRVCTRCRTDLFFSYRGESRTGRFAALIGIKGET